MYVYLKDRSKVRSQGLKQRNNETKLHKVTSSRRVNIEYSAAVVRCSKLRGLTQNPGGLMHQSSNLCEFDRPPMPLFCYAGIGLKPQAASELATH